MVSHVSYFLLLDIAMYSKALTNNARLTSGERSSWTATEHASQRTREVEYLHTVTARNAVQLHEVRLIWAGLFKSWLTLTQLGLNVTEALFFLI